MNYPIDIKYLKSFADQRYFHLIDNENPPFHSGPYIVVNFDLEHDETFGVGPTNFAFASYNLSTNKWMSVAYPEREISYYDFRDINAHNVGGHNGKITHYMDDYDLSCMLTDMLVDNFKLKEKLKGKE
jgi:hypothetical protein